MSEAVDFLSIMEPVARMLLGDPNTSMSRQGRELRFGTHGSLSVDLVKGTFFDNETKEGGGVLKLIETKTGLHGSERFEWLRANGFEVGDRGATPNGAKAASSAKIVKTYDYVDEAGNLLFQVCRLEPKTFRQRKPDGNGGWEWSVKGVRQVPYRLPEVLEAIGSGRTVLIVEGEKDADNLWSQGIPATCNAGGAGKWPASFGEIFAASDVIVVPDNDDAGEEHAQSVCRSVSDRAMSVRLMRLPGVKKKGDTTDWLDDGHTIDEYRELMERAPEWMPDSAAPFKSKFGAVRWRDLDAPGPEYDYLIKGILTRGERSLLAGASQSGKSFLATEMAYCVASGEPFAGRRTRPGLVCYQAGEGGRGLKKRLRALRKHRNLPADKNLPFVLLPSPVDLYASDADTGAFIAEVKAWAAIYKAEANVDLEMVVIDTLSAATPGANENASEDISRVLARIARISAECNCHVMLVHHMNAAGTKARGHSSLFANIENAIEVSLTENFCDGTRADGSSFKRPIRSAKVKKQKDGEDGFVLEFALKQIGLGTDADGDTITSCVIVGVNDEREVSISGADAMAAKDRAPGGFRLTPQETMFFQCVLDALENHGVAPSAAMQLPSSVARVVDYEFVKAIMSKKMLREEDNTPEGHKRHRERVKQATKRAREALTKYNVIATENPYLWWTGKPVRGFPQTQKKRADVKHGDIENGQTVDPLDDFF